jgi:hypothetical protein
MLPFIPKDCLTTRSGKTMRCKSVPVSEIEGLPDTPLPLVICTGLLCQPQFACL